MVQDLGDHFRAGAFDTYQMLESQLLDAYESGLGAAKESCEHQASQKEYHKPNVNHTSPSHPAELKGRPGDFAWTLLDQGSAGDSLRRAEDDRGQTLRDPVR